VRAKRIRIGIYAAWALPAVVACVLAGCSIGSQTNVSGGGGGHDEQIDSTTFSVTDYGGVTGTYRKVNRWNLVHCAYIADGRGFDYFIVVDRPKVDTIAGSALSGYTTSMDYGNHVRSVGDGYTKYQITRTIHLYHGSVPAGDPGAFDARTIIKDSASVTD
jgi:hypothetical protein